MKKFSEQEDNTRNVLGAHINQRWGQLYELEKEWASPSFPDTSNDMMCSGDRHDKNPKELHGRVQT